MNLPLAALVMGLALAGPAAAQDLAAGAVEVRERALKDTTAWDIVESLTTEVGARPTGSPAMERAKDWGIAKLKALGFQNVHAEPFVAGAWTRGPESAEVVAPYAQKLQILGMGRSPSTPRGGIEGELVFFDSLEALTAAPLGSLNGKIAVINQPMLKAQDGSGYGFLNRNRTRGPGEASKRGAAAFLVRSLSTDDTRLPHAGALTWPEGVKPIPAAALSVPDAQLLDRMAARGAPVRVRLNMTSTMTDKALAWNVVGEIPGSAPGEIVVVGGHLDSWDAGTGAIDDAAGVAITTAAAKLAGSAPGGLRRTLRVVMWGAEEMDYSGAAYAEAHKDEVAAMVMVGESDTGPGPVWRVRLPKGSAQHPAMRAFTAALAPLTVVVAPEPSTFGGSDVAGLIKLGAPVASLSPDATRYFDLHHSADDTLDKIDPRDLAQSVAVWASLLYAVGASDVDFRALAIQ
ncbi:MAG: M20/M25/M40 family metallo-hydrolase [Phenylobacterium sp.]|uniref:M20/M25/M40 family metallo-hydrolase n=1 Tax=Phenylobacterium sp. TaxID=1871053 RepID=UPI002732776B|nr:M20/M25/M40 family metallo-hydrolase [Phenylobacterium sp.]MDP3175810.1 M20/M25/M40 family metallo-hydrolase [Phenylobacterium sp.]